MVAGHCCIRVQKMALPLIHKGHEVHLIGSKIPSFWQNYKTFTMCADIEQYQAAIKLHPDADVFHCHNEPSWFVTAVKEVFPDKTVLLDVHDSYLARSTREQATEKLDSGAFHVRVTAEERNNFQLADALNFPSGALSDLVCGEFNLKQPHMVLPSYVPSMFYRYEGRDWHGGLVYEGKVNLPSETKGKSVGFEYCDYTDVAERCDKLGMDFHLYSARSDDKFREYYSKYKQVFIHQPLLYDELMKSIGRHDWGLVGNTIETSEWNVAAPNKLFEYFAAGLPAVSMNAAWCSEFLEYTGMGMSVSGPEELAERWSEHRHYRPAVIKHRKEWAMEAHISKLEEFYRAIA
jgi:hypothetical protein